MLALFILCMFMELKSISDHKHKKRTRPNQATLTSRLVNNLYYYMASFTIGQDEPNGTTWLATRAAKMEPSCPLGTTCCIPQEKFSQKPYTKSFSDQVCSVKLTGYWPRSFFGSLWTSTLSLVLVHKHTKKNLANIQPSWRAITHINFNITLLRSASFLILLARWSLKPHVMCKHLMPLREKVLLLFPLSHVAQREFSMKLWI